MKKWIREVRHNIAKIPIWVILVSYLATIVIFAYIYKHVPDGFYHQTISLEKSYEKEADYFSEKILGVLKKNFIEIYGKNEIRFDNIIIDIESLNANRSYVKNERVIVPINLKVKVEEEEDKETKEKMKGDKVDKPDCNAGPNVLYEDFFDISLSTNMLKINDSIYVPLVVTSNVFIQCEDIDVSKINYNQLFKNKGFLSPVIKVDENLEKEIDDFLLASKGFSNEINSHFLSMLYLSAVTITTIGYGDIVPIVWLTRTLITLEALIGVMLTGIFFNNITYKSN